MAAAISVARTKTETGGEQRAQHPAAVHREGGDHIEHGEEEIHRREPVDHRETRTLDGRKAGLVEPRSRQRDEHKGDDDIDRRAGDGDEEFLVRFFRDALEPRHAADRQQGDVGRGDAECARSEYVAEFMRQHADEQQDDEDQALPGGFGVRR